MLFITGDVCPLMGIYRYSGHPDNSKSCHSKWFEKDIKVEIKQKFPRVGPCIKPAQWVFVRQP